MMTNLRVMLLLACGLMTTACKPAPAPAPEGPAADALTTAVRAVSATAAAPDTSHLFWADPLATCDDKQVTTLHWSKEALALGAVRIELGTGAEPGTFALLGAEGQKETGAWASPGQIFVMRTHADNVERARVVLEGPNCGG